MPSDFGKQLAEAVGVTAPAKSEAPPNPAPPPNARFDSVSHLYQQFCDKLEGARVPDPRGEDVYFYAENFPYLIKLEFYNRKIRRWVDATASAAVEQLKAKTFDDSRYRVGDASRARTLFWVSGIISDPDSIHKNIHPKVTGTEIYCKRYRREGATIKVALVGPRDSGERVIITSFWTGEDWFARSAKQPAEYTRPVK